MSYKPRSDLSLVENTTVYQTAYSLAMDVFRLSVNWPSDEKFALTMQIRKSSRSVCANLSEAWSKRRYPAHFRSKLTDAEAEASETRTWLRFAKDCGYLTEPEFDKLLSEIFHVNGSLVKMIAHPEKWCIGSLVRETEPEYRLAEEEGLIEG